MTRENGVALLHHILPGDQKQITGEIAVRLTALPTVQRLRCSTPVQLQSNRRLWLGVTCAATV